MNNIKKYLPWAIRIIIFLLFILSGIAKMLPIWGFEKQLHDIGIINWCQSKYLSRLIIAFEIATGFGFLQSHYLKRIIIPSTILLLIVFSTYLSVQMYRFGPMMGDCGCFGQLIPITPVVELIKNILTIGLLVYLYKNVSEKPKGKNNFFYILLILVASALFMFFAFPYCPCEDELPVVPVYVHTPDSASARNTDTTQIKDTLKNTDSIDSVKQKK
jgi:methylamine utilization protein MauE